MFAPDTKSNIVTSLYGTTPDDQLLALDQYKTLPNQVLNKTFNNISDNLKNFISGLSIGGFGLKDFLAGAEFVKGVIEFDWDKIKDSFRNEFDSLLSSFLGDLDSIKNLITDEMNGLMNSDLAKFYNVDRLIAEQNNKAVDTSLKLLYNRNEEFLESNNELVRIALALAILRQSIRLGDIKATKVTLELFDKEDIYSKPMVQNESYRVIRDELRSVATTNDYYMLKFLVDYLGVSETKKTHPDLCKILVSSFKLPVDFNNLKSKEVLDNLLAIIKHIDPNWLGYKFGNNLLIDSYELLNSSEDLKQIIYINNNELVESLVIADNYQVEPAKTSISKLYPYF